MSKRQAYKKDPQEDVACCPCIKIKMNDIDGIEKEAQYRISYDNKNIDPERTEMNLFIHGIDKNNKPIINTKKYEIPLKNRIINLINRAGAKIRKDKKESLQDKAQKDTKESVLAIGIIFQLSHPLAMKLLREDGLLDADDKIIKGAQLKEGHKTWQFFSDTYLFAKERWGEKRIIGAYIHMDEYTPHMHLFIVPLVTKTKKYRNKELRDKEGHPLRKTSLCAKSLFPRRSFRKLWADYGEAMKGYGATAAKGLGKKGDYDDKATMEAMMDRERAEWEETKTDMSAELDSLQRQMKNVELKLSEKDEELREKEKEISKLTMLIRPLLPYYKKFISSLQSIFDKVFGEGKATVLDYDVIEEKKMVTDYHGKESTYDEYQYIVSYRVGLDKCLLTVRKNDYYESKDPLKKGVSSLFFQKQQAAIDAKNAHKLAKRSKQTNRL